MTNFALKSRLLWLLNANQIIFLWKGKGTWSLAWRSLYNRIEDEIEVIHILLTTQPELMRIKLLELKSSVNILLWNQTTGTCILAENGAVHFFCRYIRKHMSSGTIFDSTAENYLDKQASWTHKLKLSVGQQFEIRTAHVASLTSGLRCQVASR